MKFKIGDRVVVKDDYDYRIELRGKHGIIVGFYNDEEYFVNFLQKDGFSHNLYMWSMDESYLYKEPTKSIYITIDGNKTVAV